jgi:hypothetical protein
MDTQIINKKDEKKESSPKHFSEIPEPKYLGLCVNCAERFECQIRDSETVIWHCEEYK